MLLCVHVCYKSSSNICPWSCHFLQNFHPKRNAENLPKRQYYGTTLKTNQRNLHALHSSGCLNGNAKPLSIAAIEISGGFTKLQSPVSD